MPTEAGHRREYRQPFHYRVRVLATQRGLLLLPTRLDGRSSVLDYVLTCTNRSIRQVSQPIEGAASPFSERNRRRHDHCTPQSTRGSRAGKGTPEALEERKERCIRTEELTRTT